MADIAAEFVRAYYTSVVYNPDDLPQFYDQDAAAVWRDELGDAPAAPFGQAREVLVPDIPRGAKVAVLRFTALPIPSGFSIVVVGEIGDGGASRPFHQCFTLAAVQDRFFVVGDHLTFRGEVDGEFVPPDGLFEVDGRRAPPDGDEAPPPAPPAVDPRPQNAPPQQSAAAAEPKQQSPPPHPKASPPDARPQNPPPAPDRGKKPPPGKWSWTPGPS
jgi:hypothetical protein